MNPLPALGAWCGLALLAAVSAGAAQHLSPGSEPLELTLLRAVHVGASEELDLGRLRELASPVEGSYVRMVLARAALVVRDEEGPTGGWPLERMFDEALDQLHPDVDLLPPPSLPGYGRDDLIYTLTYAMVVSGQGSAAEAILRRHLRVGSEYKRSVILQALHNIGSPSAQDAIQKETETRDVGFLAGALLVHDQSPPLIELAAHWHDLPFTARTRARLLREMEGGCSGGAILSLHLAGYLPAAADPGTERAELTALRKAATELPVQGCFNGRMFGLRAYGLRTRGAPVIWGALAAQQETGWQRVLAARIGFARFPREFAAVALDRLDREPEQDVQWELLWGTLFEGKRLVFRDFWDLWNFAPHRQFRLSLPGSFPLLDADMQDRLLRWLEAGRLPQDGNVRDWLFTELARSAKAENAFRLLRRVLMLPPASRRVWVLSDLAEPAALPVLRYLRDHATEPADRESLAGGVAILEEGSSNLYSGEAPALCCEPTRACLESQVAQQVFRSQKEASAERVADEEGARRYVDRALVGQPRSIRFLDELERVAEVDDPWHAKPLRFEHLYGCWKWINAESEPAR